MASTVQRIPVSEIFVYTESADDEVYDIGMLTSDGRYIEYTVKMQIPHMSLYMERRISDMFVQFSMDRTTNVVFSEHVKEHSPLFIYFEVLQRQLKFNMSHATLDKMFARFWKKFTRVLKTKSDKAAYRKAVREGRRPPTVKFRYSTRNLLNVWNEIVRRGGCSWISVDAEQTIGLLNAARHNRRKLVRVGVYYMMMKRHLYLSGKKRKPSI